MINVTKTFLPPLDEFIDKIKPLWQSRWITNQGPLAEELESKLKEFLGVKNILLVSNGTIALQLAIKALGLEGEIITTPYSYAATTTSIIWENCKPVFADIERDSLCIDPNEIEKKISKNTSAILATHVYGIPCNTEKIKMIAEKHNLKVIYDGAHAFNVSKNNKSLFEHGDISTASFHATKLFHTIEGGAVITNDDKLAEKLFLYRAFGHLDDDYFSIGINARTSEFNAAMGLCILPKINEIIELRKGICSLYCKNLEMLPVRFLQIPEDVEYNYSYYPVFFENEKTMLEVKQLLSSNGINTRRYFYPSLNTLPYLKSDPCPVSENIASRVLCLPLYPELPQSEVLSICKIINEYFN